MAAGPISVMPATIGTEYSFCEDESLNYSLPELAWGPSSSSADQKGSLAKTARSASEKRAKTCRLGKRGVDTSPRRRRTQSVKSKSTWDDFVPWRPVSPPRIVFSEVEGSVIAAPSFSTAFTSSSAEPSHLLDSLTEVVSQASPKAFKPGSLRKKPRRWLLSDAFLKGYMFAPRSPVLDACLPECTPPPSSAPSRYACSSPLSQRASSAFAGRLPSTGSPVDARSLQSPGLVHDFSRTAGSRQTARSASSCLTPSVDDVPSLEELRLSVQQQRARWLEQNCQ